jgi:site-specific DNA-methyltransferase (adenine-specific)
VPATYLDYLAMLEDVFAECVRTLEPGGRIAVNVANLGRRPYRSLSADVIGILQDKLRLLLRGEIVWQKARGAAGSCAWGSFQRPANPVLRDLTERVVVASKGRFDRAVPARERARKGLPSEASLWADEFMEATTDVWEIPSESATRVGHPAPFPVELPERLIHLYTYRGDLVLDPFMGSGSTAVAAVRTGRHFVGYDTDEAYVTAATARVDEERRRLGAGGAGGVALPAVRPRTNGEAPDSSAARVSGRAAKVVAEALLREAGFAEVLADVRVPEGVDVSFVARDVGGRAWFFDVAGGFTTTRSGLRRADTLWRALGKAAVLHEAHPDVPLVLLATDLPAENSPGHAALRAVTGPGRPVAAVVVLDGQTSGGELAAVLEGAPTPA